MTEPPNTEALLALRTAEWAMTKHAERARAAEAELERVRAERDGYLRTAEELRMRWDDETDRAISAQARLDRAVEALREIAEGKNYAYEVARAALAEIERRSALPSRCT